MGTKRKPGRFDCYAKASLDEPMFTLLGRDKAGGLMVRLWALIRFRAIKPADPNDPPTMSHRQHELAKVTEALKCADEMDAWCRGVGRMAYISEPLLIAATEGMKEHPEGYEHACACDLCKSYGAENTHIPGVSPQPNTAKVA